MQPRIEETCVFIPELLPEASTAEWIERAERRGYEAADTAYPPSYRNNDRLVLDDDAQAAELFELIAPHVPATVKDSRGDLWELSGLNPRFRYCRYRPVQWFGIHRDGAHHDSENCRSFLTVMVYLNGADDFEGGATRFFASRCPDDGVERSVQPQRGAVIVFSHRLWHDGAPVSSGVKYIMRSDVMYRRKVPIESSEHRGYVWSIAALPGEPALCASGGRDKTVRVWNGDECVEVLRGHNLSVSAVAAAGPELLWTGSRDGTVIVWRKGRRWRKRRSVDAHDGAVVAMCRAGDRRMATGGAGGTVALWTPRGDLVDRQTRHQSWVWSLATDRDGNVLSGSEDGVITDRERIVQTGSAVRALAVAGRNVISGDGSGSLCVWDDSLRLVTRWQAHRGSITALQALPHGEIASASEDGWVRVWHLPSRRCVHSWRHDDFVSCLAVRGDGALLSGSYDGTVHSRWLRR